MNGPRTAVVVVSYGSHAMLAANLPADVVTALGARVVVVDNFSTSGERAAMRALAAVQGWDLLTPAENLGFGRGMNLGVSHALDQGADVALLVNPDLRADAATLAALAETVRTDPRLMVSPRVVHPDGQVWFAGGEVRVCEGRTFTAGADSTAATGWLSGACLAVGTDLWQTTGGFDDDYFLYWEDVDLSWRWREAGGRLEVRDDLTVVHDVGGTQGAGKSATYLRYNARNRLVFAAKHLSAGDQARWAASSLRYGRLLLRRAGLGRRDLWNAGSAVRAVAAGTVAGLFFPLADAARRRTRVGGVRPGS